MELQNTLGKNQMCRLFTRTNETNMRNQVIQTPNIRPILCFIIKIDLKLLNSFLISGSGTARSCGVSTRLAQSGVLEEFALQTTR